MAVDPKKKERVKAAYYDGLSFSEIMQKFAVSKGIISKWASTEGWCRSEIERMADEKSCAINRLDEIEQKIEQKIEQQAGESKAIRHAIVGMVDRRAELFTLVQDGALGAQKMLNAIVAKMWEDEGAETDLYDMQKYVQATATNARILLPPPQPTKEAEKESFNQDDRFL